jgi:LacI family transcriptional regulator
MPVQEIKRPAKTLYEKVEASIRSDIFSSNIKPGQRLASSEEFASKLNVSEGTVRHAFQRLAAQGVIVRKPRVGTFVNKEAQATVTKSAAVSSSIALMVPRMELPDWANLASGLYEGAHANSLDVTIANTEDDPERYDVLVQRHIENNMFGMAIGFDGYKPPLTLETIYLLKQSGIPVVTLFGCIQCGGWPTVISDYEQHMYIAAKHLCELGRKRIAFVGTNRIMTLQVTELNLTQCGFMRALCEAGVEYHPDLQFIIDQWSEDRAAESGDPQLEDAIQKWLSVTDIDAVCCTSDHTASRVYHALSKLGRKVPDDIAVTGCGNLAKYHGILPHTLTTVDMCVSDIGSEACRLLVAMRNGEDVGEITVVVKGKLLTGSSTVKS